MRAARHSEPHSFEKPRALLRLWSGDLRMLKIRCCTHSMHFVEKIRFCIIAILLLPRDLCLHNDQYAYAKNTVMLLSECTTLFLEF
ncbi:uncharacterized protein BJ212DRAFT_1362651 [Suillus subaureus]|uniref:Uncharacterized protein n=1 Tax=Suillus subaureus TaxID=48587 RepID=A0A9P7E895_9AGAM|nr:uncharacterized protein BJ212DRAFT_1362651 [Suillus subaureus]KAG1814287.1 hypothetical protein BJ212DRAFT_1362651 [Suillus subaureus]